MKSDYGKRKYSVLCKERANISPRLDEDQIYPSLGSEASDRDVGISESFYCTNVWKHFYHTAICRPFLFLKYLGIPYIFFEIEVE